MTQDLTYKNEKPLFFISASISILLWVCLILGTAGIALIYIFLFFIFYLFSQGAMISHIKGTAVKLSEDQFPDLYAQLEQCCKKLGMKVPEVYILNGDGLFNAFATRFLGRHFVVLFSNIVDALDENPDALNFYLGHELGHIHRKHLIWGPILLPSGFLPLLGAAYSRAREYTCDNYGFACTQNPQNAVSALATLSAGAQRWKTLRVDSYISQVDSTGGFWMSFCELLSDYPWLIKRMTRIVARAKGVEPEFPNRNVLAWLLCAFIPRTGAGGKGGSSFLVTIVIIGILAAIAIPNYVKFKERAKAVESGYDIQEEYSEESYGGNANEPAAPVTEKSYPDTGNEEETYSLEEPSDDTSEPDTVSEDETFENSPAPSRDNATDGEQ